MELLSVSCCEGRRTPCQLAFGGKTDLYFSVMFFVVFIFLTTKELLSVGAVARGVAPLDRWLLVAQ